MRTIWLMILPLALLGCDAPVNAPININPTVEAGLVSPGAVQVDPNAVQVAVLSALETVEAQVEMTMRRLEQRAESRADAKAGRDSTQTVTTVALDGSGWPLVGVGVICIGAVGAWWWYKRKAARTEGWLSDVTTQIQKLPAAQRNLLTGQIDGRVRQEAVFKKWLETRNLRADRPKDAPGSLLSDSGAKGG